jgi:hypothetical protein
VRADEEKQRSEWLEREMDNHRIRDLYKQLEERAEKRVSQFAIVKVLTRLRDGLKHPHSLNVISLFWWYIFLNDRPLYGRLKTATDEAEIRQILVGKVMNCYVQGEKTIAVYSDIFPPGFFKIIDAYIDFTDEISADPR